MDAQINGMLWGLLAIALAVTGCGGSDSNEDTHSPALGRCAVATTPAQQTGDGITLYLQPHYLANHPGSIAASLSSGQSQAWQFHWQQLAGPTLSFSSDDTQVLAFEASAVGNYRFQVSATNANGTEQRQTDVSFDVETGMGLAVRLGHAVVEGGDISVRLGRINGTIATDISWCIAAGPQVSLDLSDQEVPLLTAPEVSSDTLLLLRANATVDGVTQSGEVGILITDEPTINSTYFDAPIARVHAYRADSPWREVLQACSYSTQLQQSCAIASLPLLGQETGENPSDIDAILNRVLVSHDWMGRNFEAFLRQLDPYGDFATLLQSVTAIVISSDIRPSYYWVVTGAIYLDPENLWRLASERDSINEAADYRSSYGANLQFLMPWRYVKNDDYATVSRPIALRQDRPLAELEPEMAALLYHELAHANDYFPRSVHATLSGPTLLDDYNRRSAKHALGSDQLTLSLPLQSAEMTSLAGVRYLGDKETSAEKAYLPDDVSGFFSADRANDFYNYSSHREDAAMLFEEAMMRYRLGIDRDVAVTDRPAVATASSITVNWGQRGRVAESNIQPRLIQFVDYLLPELGGETVAATLPAPQALRAGESWLANLQLNSTPSAVKSLLRITDKHTTPPLQLTEDRDPRSRQ